MQKYLEDPIAEELLKGIFVEGTVIRVQVDSETGELRFTGAAEEKAAGDIAAENSAGVGDTPSGPPGEPDEGKKG